MILLLLVIGILRGGHVFVYDVCQDDLCLVKGKPEFDQVHDDPHIPSHQHTKVDQVDEKLSQNQINVEQFQSKSTFVQRSIKVRYFWYTSTFVSFEALRNKRCIAGND